ncbi:MAG TPA: ABC transporter substrate-binding protein [Streptosporangiaceae bacterium]
MVRPSGRYRSLRSRKKLAGIAIVAVAALTAAGCGGGSGNNSSNNSKLSTNGNTATWADVSGFTPNFIFPFTDAAHFGTWNIDDMQYLLYRPMYWYGDNESPTVDYNESLAGAPTWDSTGKVATVTLKPYKWSNGETVNSDSLMFWMNMMKAEKANWGGYVPPYFPDNVVSYKAVGTNQFQLTFDKAYNQQWVLYNELSQLYPIPAAWDVTSLTGASGSGGCDKSVAKCAKVYNFLIAQNRNLSGYATSKIWGVVDGPWKLSSFNPDGAATFVPNKSYSGPGKPKLTAFKEEQFASDTAEYNLLKSGPGASNGVQVGYAPYSDITSPTTNPMKAGANPLAANYKMIPWIGYGINYFPANFNNPTVGPIIKQLYFRQALAYTVDDSAIIKSVYKGYGYVNTQGVPTLPSSSTLAPGLQNDQFPFNTGKARALLAANGWSASGDPATCVKPGTAAGDCGAGITKGEKLQFQVQYASGSQDLTTIMTAFQSDAGKAGIDLVISAQAGQTITANDTSCSPSKATPCKWQMGNWGGGWIYAPDYYPSGEDLFAKGSLANYGSYNDPKNNQLIANTLVAKNPQQAMYTWEKYLAKQVPVIFMPQFANPLLEVANNLQGVVPNTFENIEPENWHYVK